MDASLEPFGTEDRPPLGLDEVVSYCPDHNAQNEAQGNQLVKKPQRPFPVASIFLLGGHFQLFT